MANAMTVIFPYKYQGMWVFDDEAAGLTKEPFVEGADTLIDNMISLKGLTDADAGFRILFSAGPFPRHDIVFQWVREGEGGNFYKTEQFEGEAWLCPALFKYFEEAPREIYARFEERTP